MANNPSFSFYVNDFEGGTRHMTDAEVGCYLRVLLAQFNRGGVLPNDENFLRRFCTSFEESWPIVKEKFHPVGENLIQNKRLEIERVKKVKFIENQRQNGQKGGRPKKPDAKAEEKPEETQAFDLLKAEQKPLGNGYGNGIGNGIEEKGGMGEGEKSFCQKMIDIFKNEYPNYPEDAEDLFYCRAIAWKIAKSYGWTSSSATAERANDILQKWRNIAAFSKTDTWYSGRSIPDFSKEFKRLIQKMNNGSINSTSSGKTVSGSVPEGGFRSLRSHKPDGR